MLTRLKVNGFKNLVNVDVRFGPFTCVAGANGVGKSNLFDAIQFLSALADKPLLEAALSVRDKEGRTADVRSLFHHIGDEYDTEMSFEAEMIVPQKGSDDLGQEARATRTFLRYALTLAYRTNNGRSSPGKLEITNEELSQITVGDTPKNILFPYKPAWLDTAVTGRRWTRYFISTEETGPDRKIKLHQDTQKTRMGGRSFSLLVANLPRTALSTTNASENPTALLARREMQSWRLLQLEPSALRKPDEFTAPPKLDADGAHLAATLNRLARSNSAPTADLEAQLAGETQIYGQIANRLAQLIKDVREIRIDRDDRRELYTLQLVDRDRTTHAARALSDGTLRFLALAVIELDSEFQGVLCLEEPENGIHPARIPAMLQLLQDIATDVEEPVSPDNPLRQVIVNTHSPAVVKQVPEDSLLFAELKQIVRGEKKFEGVRFSCLRDTWRANAPEEPHIVDKGTYISYLDPTASTQEAREEANGHERGNGRRPKRRVMDRPDVRQMMLELFSGTE